MFECVARPRYVPGYGWITLENADTADLGDEAHAQALAHLHALAQQRADAKSEAIASSQANARAEAEIDAHPKERAPDGPARRRLDDQLPGGPLLTKPALC